MAEKIAFVAPGVAPMHESEPASGALQRAGRFTGWQR
jgi:hypothetical protein